MTHRFYPGREDGNIVDATVVGYLDFEPATRRVRRLRLVTDRASYGQGRWTSPSVRSRDCGRWRLSLSTHRPSGTAMGSGDGMGIHVVMEPLDPAIAQDEDHRPFGLDSLAGRLDSLALMAEDHDLFALGEILLRLEDLELGRLTERLEELRHLVTPAMSASVG